MYLKKIFTYSVIAAMMISAATGISSCAKDGKDGDKGEQGAQGDKGDRGDAGETFTVTFVYDNGSPNATQSVVDGGWAVQPPTPAKSVLGETAGLYAGTMPATFIEWRHNGAAFDFAAPITADITLTAHWTANATPIGSVTANDVKAAVDYANANPGEYTLLIDEDVEAGMLRLNVDYVRLTIIGIGEERTIQFKYNGGVNESLFALYPVHGHSLTLGQNITLRGTTAGSLLVEMGGGLFIMLEGSKITGHSASCVLWLTGGGFIMHGGEITGNHTPDNFTGCIWATYEGTVTMTGGRIAGNTRDDHNEPMDVVLSTEYAIANSRKTGGYIGVSIPAAFAAGD